MTQLLVSVRSVNEAEAALAGGASIIDVKEPAFGSLGKAEDKTIAAVVQAIAGRRPVSAAFGELKDQAFSFPPALAYVKWGLAGCDRDSDWHYQLIKASHCLLQTVPSCQAVAVAYADWHLAQAPTVAEVCAFACENRWNVLLVDTWEKTGRCLLDWLPSSAIHRLVQNCHQAGVRIALAGSLVAQHFPLLLAFKPDWLAVRGAACRQDNRRGTIDVNKVRELTNLLNRSRISMPAN